MTQNDAIKITDLKKNYGKQAVLKGIDLTVKSGSIFGLIGLNGVGKTTMIKNILGLARYDAGNITLFDHPIDSIEARKNLVFLPEKFQPSQLLKGHEFLKLSLQFYKVPYDMDKAISVARHFGLDEDKLHKRVTTYSKGMCQKLGLMSAFLCKAPLLILDEPMSGLDPKARAQLKDMITGYAKQGNTVFFSSHMLADLDELCDEIAILHDGKIQFCGTPADLKQQEESRHLERAFLSKIAA